MRSEYSQLRKTFVDEKQFFDDTCNSTSDWKFETAIIDISIYIAIFGKRSTDLEIDICYSCMLLKFIKLIVWLQQPVCGLC